jgi:hypothetical protein
MTTDLEQTRKELGEHMGKVLANISIEHGPDEMIVTCQQLVEQLMVLAGESAVASDEDWDREANPSQ